MSKKKNKTPTYVIPNNSRILWHGYTADKGGCGHIRVIWPYILCNIHRFADKNIQLFPTYGMTYNLDVNFYKNKLFTSIQRAVTKEQLDVVNHFIKNIKNQIKIGLLYELDDDLIDIPVWNMAAEYHNKNRKYAIEIIAKCDGVTVSTEYLAKKLRKYNKNVVVNSNHLPKFLWGPIKNIEEIHSNKKPKILWSGSANHFALPNSKYKGGDFGNELINFIKKTTDKYQWVLIGAMPNELNDIKDKIEFHGWQNVLYYPQYLKSLNIDIGIAPLQDLEFNRSKSNIKALEYTAASIPAVYSNVEPYKGLTYTAETDEYMIDRIETLANSDLKRKEVFEKDYNILKNQLFWEENDNIIKYLNNYLSFFNMKLPD